MVNPQKENGFIPIANEIVEQLARADWFGGSNARIMWAIFRKTYGWHKKEDEISISQLVEMTGLSKRTVIYTLQELEAKKIILIVRNSKYGLKTPNTIKFNKYYDTWVVQNSAIQVKNNRNRAKISSAKQRVAMGGSAKLRDLVVQNSVNKVKSFAHTKETITKDNTKETSDVPSRDGVHQDIVQIIDSFKEINPVYKKWYGNTTQRGAIQRLLETHGKEQLLRVLEFLPISNKTPFIPVATTPLQLEDKWAAITDSWAKKKVELLTNVNKYKIAF